MPHHELQLAEAAAMLEAKKAAIPAPADPAWNQAIREVIEAQAVWLRTWLRDARAERPRNRALVESLQTTLRTNARNLQAVKRRQDLEKRRSSPLLRLIDKWWPAPEVPREPSMFLANPLLGSAGISSA